MEIFIHSRHNVEIKLELGFFDVVTDIKAKIQSLTGVVATRQALFFNNTLLQDDWDIARCSFFDRSHVSLIIRNPAPVVFGPDQSVVTVLVRLPVSKRHVVIETGLKNRVEELKQRIGQKEGISTELLTMFLLGRELEDQCLIGECDGIETDDAVVEVGLVGSGGYKIDHSLAKVVIFLAPINVKFPMTLNSLQSFRDLRKQLERLKKENRISLPKDWFFVYRKERVMVECLSFDKFKVQDGDVLQVLTAAKLYQNPPDAPPATIRVEDTSSPKVLIKLKMPAPISPISIEMSPNDTFSKLKDKIHEMEQLTPNRVILHYSNKELHDQISVREFDGKEVGVSVKQSPTASIGSGASQGSLRKLKLLTWHKTWPEQIPMEVNAGEKVGGLRKELAMLQERMGLSLPAEFFFICNQNVMDDAQSFRWHGLRHDDLIEIFSGSVSGGR